MLLGLNYMKISKPCMGYIVPVGQNIQFTRPNYFLTMGEILSEFLQVWPPLRPQKSYFPGLPQDTGRLKLERGGSCLWISYHPMYGWRSGICLSLSLSCFLRPRCCAVEVEFPLYKCKGIYCIDIIPLIVCIQPLDCELCEGKDRICCSWFYLQCLAHNEYLRNSCWVSEIPTWGKLLIKPKRQHLPFHAFFSGSWMRGDAFSFPLAGLMHLLGPVG